MNHSLKNDLEENINSCYQASSEYSSALSSICRQIAFAEGALYWFAFTGFHFPAKYIIVGYLFLLFYFFIDSFQYVLGYVAYKRKAKQNVNLLKNKITKMDLHTITEDDLFWVYKAMHYKLFFIVLSSITIICIFTLLLICQIVH